MSNSIEIDTNEQPNVKNKQQSELELREALVRLNEFYSLASQNIIPKLEENKKDIDVAHDMIRDIQSTISKDALIIQDNSRRLDQIEKITNSRTVELTEMSSDVGWIKDRMGTLIDGNYTLTQSVREYSKKIEDLYSYNSSLEAKLTANHHKKLRTLLLIATILLFLLLAISNIYELSTENKIWQIFSMFLSE